MSKSSQETEIVKKIISAGIHAPSGENSQPWSFVVHGNEILLYNRPERDQSIYNWGQRGSYVAHGACIENMSIAAASLGYELNPHFFPDKMNLEHTVSILLQPTTPRVHPLYPYIEARGTNRKTYENLAISENNLSELGKTALAGTYLSIITDPEKRAPLGRAVALGDQVLFENQALHNFFFEHIHWTREEDNNKKVGFFIDTLELPPPAKKAFRLFRYWPVAKFLGLVGITKKIAEQNASIYASGGAIAIISTPTNTPEDFVKAGQTTERLWLTATKLGLSCQPMTAILFFMNRILAGEATQFSTEHTDLIKKAHEIISTSTSKRGTMIMMLRIGTAKPPSARSLRFPVEDFIKT